MQSNLEPHWAAARGHELNGEPTAAREAYEAILRIDPTQAFAWHRLSALALLQGRYRDAHAAAMEGTAVALAHHRWKALPYLTQQMLGFDEREAVRRAIESADWSAQAVLAQSAVLAQQLWLADAHAVALRLADHALGVVPRSHLLHYVRANVLRHLGRMDEATQAFEHCLALAPQFAEAHWALAYHAKADPPGARIPRVRAALAAALGHHVPGAGLEHEAERAEAPRLPVIQCDGSTSAMPFSRNWTLPATRKRRGARSTRQQA